MSAVAMISHRPTTAEGNCMVTLRKMMLAIAMMSCNVLLVARRHSPGKKRREINFTRIKSLSASDESQICRAKNFLQMHQFPSQGVRARKATFFLMQDHFSEAAKSSPFKLIARGESKGKAETNKQAAGCKRLQ